MSIDRQDIEALYPLTPLQEGMLFHSLDASHEGVYVEQMSCRAPVRIERERWQSAWNQVIAAQPCLRAAVAWEGLAKPMLVVLRARKVQLQVREIDASEDDDAAFAERLANLRREEIAQGFELHRAPLLRQILLQRRDTTEVFWVYHHIIMDGWSAFVALGEVLAAYAAALDGAAWQPREACSYAGYLRWREQQDMAGAQRWWRGELQGFAAATPLALVERTGTDPQRDAAASVQCELGKDLAVLLRETARASRCTLGNWVQTAWALTLAAYSGERDVMFGLTVAGRPAELAGSDAMVGLFINTVPVRVQIDPTQTGDALVRAVQARAVERAPHEHAALTDIAGWSEVARGKPLFQSMLAIESFPYTESVSLDSVSVWQQTNFPLTLVLDPVGSMKLRALFDPRNHAPQTVERMLEHLRCMLRSLLTQHESPVGLLSMQGSQDAALQASWNHQPFAWDAEAQVGALYERSAREHADAVALVAADGQRLTHAQLESASRAWALRLREAGARAGDVVALCFEPSVDLIAALVGITRLGCAYAPLDPHLPPARLQQMISNLGVRCVAAGAEQAPMFAGLAQEGQITLLQPCDATPEQALVAEAMPPDALFYVIHTSGSTGLPKAAGVYHRSFARFIQWWNADMALAPGERCLLINKISFDLAQKCVWGALLTGGELHLLPTAHFDAEAALHAVSERAIHWINCTPSMATTMLELSADPHRDLASLRLLMLGGEPIDKRWLAHWLADERCQTRLVNTYGPTECTDLCTVHHFAPEEFRELARPVSVGRVLPGLAVHVLDRFGNRQPCGVSGDVVIAGGSVGIGYLGNPALTADRFRADPWATEPGARLYFTGDRGYFNEDGSLIVSGRTDFQVKLRGYRIELDAIAYELRSHPQVRDAVVTLSADGQQLIAYVVVQQPVEGEFNPSKQLGAHLASRLAHYMVPSVYVELPALPMNANGKLDRSQLPEPALTRTAGPSGNWLAPRNETETALHALWAEVLGHASFGVDDNFFELGGHSLNISRLYARLQKTFGVRVPLVLLFEQATIAQQALAIDAARSDTSATAADAGIRRIARPERLPLSYAQSRLWFLHQFDPQSLAYNVPNVLRLGTRADTGALRQALDWLHARHETLRTSFVADGGEPWQVVHAAAEVDLAVHDLCGQADALEQLQLLALSAASTRFDLSRGPLAHYTLVQTDEGAVLLMTLHHIVTDGWSMDVLVKELQHAYAAFSAGRQPELPALPLQYVDYALHVREQINQHGAAGLSYWRNELGDSQAHISLPYDHPRGPVLSTAGRLLVTHIDAQTATVLRQLGRAHGATEFMVLLALFNVLLYRFSGQSDFNVGSPIANRQHAEIENLIGFFVNTLVLRARVDGQQDFLEHLQQVRATASRAFEHQDLPFEYLVEQLNPERHPASQPLFQIGFALQRAFEDTSLLDPDQWIARFDLQLVLHPQPDGSLRAHWEYATALFESQTIIGMAAAFEQLARGIAADPKAAVIDRMCLLSPELEREIAECEMGPQLEQPPMRVHELFEQQAAAQPGARALESVAANGPSTVLNYQQLNEQANQLAHLMIAKGVKRGDRIGLSLPRTPQLIVALLAILKAGAAYVPLDPDFPDERLQHMQEDSGVQLVLTLAVWHSRFADRCKVLVLDEAQSALAAQPRLNPGLAMQAHDLAYVLFTSGSTGRPKGVMVGHAAVVRLVHRPNFVQLDARERVLQFANIGFDASTLEIWGALCNGATLIQAPAGQLSLETLSEFLTQEHISTAFLTTSLFHRMVEDHGDALSGIAQLLVGGEAMSPAHAARAIDLLTAQGGRLINGYGPTETTTFATCWPVTSSDVRRLQVPIGVPLNQTVCRVLNAAGQRQPLGVEGELYIGGAGLAEGYAGRDDLTQRAFVADLFGAPSARLYRTGDRVRRRADGVLVYMGRIDQQVKLRGYRIELDEVASALREHAGVEAVHVQAVGEGADKRLVAHVLGGALDQQAMKQVLGLHLPAFMIPAQILRVDVWPLTPNGKLDVRALPAPDGATQAPDWEAPATEMEQRVAQIWEEMLGVSRISATANFFDLGGNSLSSTRLLALVRERVGHSVTIPVFFADATVRAMARHLERAKAGLDIELEDKPVDGERESAIELPRVLPSRSSSLEQVLLTGGTGFLGAYLVREILTRWPGVHLHAHVRAASSDEGLQRLRSNLQEYGLWQEEFAHRLHVFTGDLGAPRMGLDEDRWQVLAKDVDLIIHNASLLNHVLPYAALKSANVLPTQRLLELAAAHKLKGFMYVSTSGTLRPDGKGRVVDESHEIERETHLLCEGYNASKWVAELMVRRAARAGMPVQIARLGRVVVDSEGGQGRLDDFVALFVRTCLRVGAYPDYPLVEQIVPVDYLGAAVVALAGDHTQTAVHHLVGTRKSDWSRLLPDHADCAHAGLRKMDVRDWVDAVKKASVIEPLPFAPYLFWWDTDAAAPEEKRQQVRSNATVRALERLGVKEPKVASTAWVSYLEKVFEDENKPFQARRKNTFSF